MTHGQTPREIRSEGSVNHDRRGTTCMSRPGRLILPSLIRRDHSVPANLTPLRDNDRTLMDCCNSY